MTERIPGAAPLNKKEAADLLGVSTRTISRYLAAGQVPHAKLPGGRVLIQQSAIDAILSAESLPVDRP